MKSLVKRNSDNTATLDLLPTVRDHIITLSSAQLTGHGEVKEMEGGGGAWS